MGVEAIYDTSQLPICDLFGIVIVETSFCGIVNNCPLWRRAVPYLSFDLYAKSNRRLRVLVRDANLNVIDLTGATGIFTIKATKASPVVIQKTTNNPSQGFIGAADEGEMYFLLVPDDTETIDIRQYVFDIRLNQASGATYTIVEGVINLLEPVG